MKSPLRYKLQLSLNVISVNHSFEEWGILRCSASAEPHLTRSSAGSSIRDLLNLASGLRKLGTLI